MLTIPDWVRLNSLRHPTREAYIGADGRATFAEIAELAWSLARGLASHGVTRGQPVGVLAANNVFNARTFLGIACSGGIYTAYNWRWAAEELADGIEESEPGIILVEERFVELLEEALGVLGQRSELPGKIRVIRQGDIDTIAHGTGEFRVELTPQDGLCLLFTGGSTGRSKAVLLSHQSGTANGVNEYMDLRLGALPEERGLMVTPMFHSAGLLCWLMTHLVAGKPLVLAERFDEESLLEIVESERVTNTFMIPNMMRRVMQAGVLNEPGFTRTFRAMHTGAGLLRMPDKERFFELLPEGELHFRYGLTEAGPQVTRHHSDDMLDPSVDGSMGQEYTFVESRITSLDDDNRECEPGELGEICVRGPSIMTGYYGRPEVTAETIRNGWLHTGDLAIRDERGFYYFKDRLKEMIKSGGENVYCVEVENFMYLHPAILEAAVVGVPTLEWDEEVRAVVVLRDGVSASEAEIKQFLRGHLAGYKVPKQIAFLTAPELPRTGAGKLVKGKLKEKMGWIGD